MADPAAALWAFDPVRIELHMLDTPVEEPPYYGVVIFAPQGQVLSIAAHSPTSALLQTIKQLEDGAKFIQEGKRPQYPRNAYVEICHRLGENAPTVEMLKTRLLEGAARARWFPSANAAWEAILFSLREWGADMPHTQRLRHVRSLEMRKPAQGTTLANPKQRAPRPMLRWRSMSSSTPKQARWSTKHDDIEYLLITNYGRRGSVRAMLFRVEESPTRHSRKVLVADTVLPSVTKRRRSRAAQEWAEALFVNPLVLLSKVRPNPPGEARWVFNTYGGGWWGKTSRGTRTGLEAAKEEVLRWCEGLSLLGYSTCSLALQKDPYIEVIEGKPFRAFYYKLISTRYTSRGEAKPKEKAVGHGAIWVEVTDIEALGGLR